MSVVPDGAETRKLESPSRVTGLRQSQCNGIIAANNPVWGTDLPGRGSQKRVVVPEFARNSSWIEARWPSTL